MRLGGARAGQGALDHDVQRDGRRPLGRLDGGAGRVEQHGDGLGERVGVGVLVVEVVRVDVLAGGRGWPVRGQRGRRGRGRQLEAQRQAAVLLQREVGGVDEVAGGEAVLRAALGDGRGPLGGHRRGGLGRRQAGLAEVDCKWREKCKLLFILEKRTASKRC